MPKKYRTWAVVTKWYEDPMIWLCVAVIILGIFILIKYSEVGLWGVSMLGGVQLLTRISQKTLLNGEYISDSKLGDL